MEEESKAMKQQPKKNLWKPEEDMILRNYVETHGEGNWATVSQESGKIISPKTISNNLYKTYSSFSELYSEERYNNRQWWTDFLENITYISGLMRGGKSCRLRWKNYLRPNIKRGGMSKEEEDLIIRMHKLLGNR